MNVSLPITRQPRLLSEGGGPSPVLLAVKVEVGYRAKESQTEALSPRYSIEARSTRAETITSVSEEILRSRPVPHWDINE